MEVDFESSAEEEDVHDLNIVISEVCSVLDVEQVGRVVENPLFSEDTDSSDESEDYLKDEDYIYVKESPDQTNLYNNKANDFDNDHNWGTKAPTSINSDARSRSCSTSADVAPNQGLYDDHKQVHADDGELQEPVSEGVGPVGSLVWAKMRGYPSWPAIVVPDPLTGRSREVRMGKQGGEWRHVLFLEYRNEVAWMHKDQLKVFSTKGSSKVKGKNKALVKAVELASSLSSMNCMDRIRSFTEYQQVKMEEKSTKGISVGEVWAKLSMNPIVRLKRIKIRLKPVVMLERIKVIESEIDSDESEDASVNSMADTDIDDSKFTRLKSLPRPAPPLVGWCEGMLVWARVQGYPFWPALIVREQQSEEFSIPSKAGMVRLHVMFLAYQKQHAWLGETALVPFHSSDQFKTSLVSGNKKSQKDFVPTKKLASKFSEASKIATELLPRSLYHRLEYLYT